MIVDEEIILETAAEDAEVHFRLRKAIGKCLSRFPALFDNRLYKGLDLILVNSSSDFLSVRSFCLLQKLLLCQFFLQKKMESALKEGAAQKPLFLKLFSSSSRVTISLIFHEAYHLHREQILKGFRSLHPGFLEMPRSFFLWRHPELPYLFSYLEVYKLRGEEISKKELKGIEKALSEQLVATPPLTPALFWPYNEEESYRHVQLLQREIHTEEDLPHVSVQFREQTPSSLEFLILLVRPKSDMPLDQCLERLPDSLHSFFHFKHLRQSPFPVELGAFSLKVPAFVFDVQDSINLLYARRYVLKCLEAIIGPFRDYNGGLFETQQQHFETLRVNLGNKVRHFDLFAEKLFYALHPVERRLSLSFEEAEDLFTTFSEAMQDKGPFAICNRLENAIVVRGGKNSDYPLFDQEAANTKITARAQLSVGGFHYLCLLNPRGTPLQPLRKKTVKIQERTKVLKLIFQEGRPPSLNPCHTFGDMRCRVLSKLLFEGLTRLDQHGNPELAGAAAVLRSPDGFSYIFKLRPSHWSNGEKVTSVDYVMSVQYALSDHMSHPELLFMLKNGRQFREKKISSKDLGIRAIDGDTLQLILEQPDSHFLHKLAKPFFFPLFGPMREPKWFNGPYLVREQSTDGILLEKNPYYWDTKRPFFEQIEIGWQNDIESIYSSFQEGKTDWIGEPLSILPPHLVELLKKEGNLHKQQVLRHFIICFNTRHPLLSSPSIRRALSLAIDRAFICQSIFPESIPVAPLQPNAEEANALFDEGLKELGMHRENLPTLTFSYSHQTRREMLAKFLQMTWQKILKIPIRLEQNEWNLFRNKLEKGFFDISGTVQEKLSEDSFEYYERAEGASSWNFSGWTHPSYRETIHAAEKETHAELKSELLRAADEILIREVPFTPLFNYTHLYAHHPDLVNYLLDPEGCVDFCQTIIGGAKQCGK